MKTGPATAKNKETSKYKPSKYKMDKSIRNLIQKATQDARRLLEADFAGQLEGTFNILPDGHMAPLPGKHLSDDEKIIREKIMATIAHEKAGGVSDAGAVAGYFGK